MVGEFQSFDDPFFSERCHDREQAGRDALSGESDARAVDERACLYAFFGGKIAQEFFRGSFAEIRVLFIKVREFRELRSRFM